MIENNQASSSSSGTRWGECRPTFAVELGSWAAKESKIPNRSGSKSLLQCKLFFNLHE